MQKILKKKGKWRKSISLAMARGSNTNGLLDVAAVGVARGGWVVLGAHGGGESG